MAFDLNCRYTIWNLGMERLSGIKQSDVLGRCAVDVFPFLKATDEDRFFFEALAGRTAVAQERPFTIPQSGKSGFFEGYYSPLRGETGDVIGGLAIIRDISARKQAEDALLESEVKLRSIIESANDAIVLVNMDGVIVLWNSGAEKIFGFQDNEVLDQSLTMLMPERFRQAHLKGLERIRAGKTGTLFGQSVELVGLRKDGTEFPIELTLSTWKAGAEVFYSGIIRDITDRKRSDQALQRAHAELEKRVQERTRELAQTNAALQDKISDLEKFHDVVVGRELKMIQLEEELKHLKAELRKEKTEKPAHEP